MFGQCPVVPFLLISLQTYLLQLQALQLSDGIPDKKHKPLDSSFVYHVYLPRSVPAGQFPCLRSNSLVASQPGQFGAPAHFPPGLLRLIAVQDVEPI